MWPVPLEKSRPRGRARLRRVGQALPHVTCALEAGALWLTRRRSEDSGTELPAAPPAHPTRVTTRPGMYPVQAMLRERGPHTLSFCSLPVLSQGCRDGHLQCAQPTLQSPGLRPKHTSPRAILGSYCAQLGRGHLVGSHRACSRVTHTPPCCRHFLVPSSFPQARA